MQAYETKTRHMLDKTINAKLCVCVLRILIINYKILPFFLTMKYGYIISHKNSRHTSKLYAAHRLQNTALYKSELGTYTWKLDRNRPD